MTLRILMVIGAGGLLVGGLGLVAAYATALRNALWRTGK